MVRIECDGCGNLTMKSRIHTITASSRSLMSSSGHPFQIEIYLCLKCKRKSEAGSELNIEVEVAPAWEDEYD